MMSRSRKWRTVRAGFVAIVVATVSGPAGALFREGARWPIDSLTGETVIEVCFRPPGTVTAVPLDGGGGFYTIDYGMAAWLAKQAIVRDAIEDSWGKWTLIRFQGWGTCPAGPLDGYLFVDLIRNDCGGCGNSGRGYSADGVYLWLMMENFDERLLRTVAIHEFGHALAFHHEMDRPDAFAADGVPLCNNGPVLFAAGIYLTPYYDDVSLMNYCGPRNRNGLSAGDIEGSQNLYGTSRAGRWLQVQPMMSLHGM